MEKKLIETCTYEFRLERREDGTSHLTRTNKGFNAFELLGLMELTQADVIEQIRGEVKPDTIERKVIVDAKNPTPHAK